MHVSNISDAKTHLSQLINRALAGDEVIISRFDQPLVKLTPIQLDTTPRVGGQWAGKVQYHASVEEMDKEVEALFDASTIFPSEDA
jgi:prevent-host-death family protein